jgi:hypothetical protein
LVGWIRTRSRIAKRFKKIEEKEELSCFEMLDVLFEEAEGFYFSLDVLHGGLGIP